MITGVNLEFEGDMITHGGHRQVPAGHPGAGLESRRAGPKSTLLVPARTLADAARMMATGVPVRVMTRGTDGGVPARGAGGDPAGSLARPMRRSGSNRRAVG